MTQQAAIRYLEDVKMGDELPALRKEISMVRMAAYAAATWDLVRIHYDAEAAKQAGFPQPIVDGQMLGAYLTQLVQEWAGPKAFLKKLSFQNRRMVFPGDVLTCKGQVISSLAIGGEGLVECRLWIENQKGEAVVDPASATVRMPVRGSQAT
jgi:acyl dehydratase